MLVTLDCKGKATVNFGTSRVNVWTFQSAACQNGLPGSLKRNAAKFLPVANKVLLYNDFMDGKFALISQTFEVKFA